MPKANIDVVTTLKPIRILVSLIVPSVCFVRIGSVSTVNVSIVIIRTMSTTSSRSCYRIQFFSPTSAPPVSPMRFLVVAPALIISPLYKRPPEFPMWFLVCSVLSSLHKSTSCNVSYGCWFVLAASTPILFDLFRDLAVGLFVCFSLLHLRLLSYFVCDLQGWVVLSLFPSPCCIFVCSYL